MAAAPPAGTVTFLCAAVDAKSSPWEDGASAPAAALDHYQSIGRSTLARHGGFLLAAADDTLAAVFPTAVDAADAAVDLQQRLLADRDGLGFAVGIGLHTGETADGTSNYDGPEAARAARLTSLAYGGQIVVSETTELLLRGRMTLRTLGEHRLRDLSRRMTVHQLVADGLPPEFPALGGAAASIGNLPEQTTSFVGREALLAEVADLVRGNRLVTLGGAGGVGKTRLAYEVGAGLADEFPDGVWVVDLAAVGEAESVPAAIATALGVRPRGDGRLIDAVTEVLSNRRSLVLLDNCEHLLTAVSDAINVIFAREGTVRILATSREYLWIPGETLLEVPPLAVDGGTDSHAAQLFLDRARSVRSTFAMDEPQTAAAVTEICATLDGMPLGLELAAARMAAMSAIEVRDRLGARFRLLRGQPAAPERQQTLLRAVEWSYDLLDVEEQKLLTEAAVFTGGFDLATMSAISGGDDVDVLGELDSLVRKSMVVADHSATRTRYRLYETIRQFAEDRLTDAGRLERMRDRHAAHFASAAAARWETWNGPGWGAAVEWVQTDLGNLRTAFRWSRQRGDMTVATDIATHAALMGFSVELFETVAWAEELVESAPADPSQLPRLPRLLTAAGYACFVGRAEAATRHAHRAVELEPIAGYDPCEPGYAMFVEALGQVYCGHLDRYVELTETVATRFGGARGYALAAYVDGLQASGRTVEALELVDASIAAAREVANPYWLAYALWIAGQAWSKTDPQRALATWDEAVEHVRHHRVHFFDGFLARDAARLHTSDGRAERALGLFDVAVTAAHQAGNIAQLIITLASVPALLERLDRYESAATLLGALSREPASFHHVPGLSDLGERLARQFGPERAAELRSSGAALDLQAAAVWTLVELTAARGELRRQADAARPAGLSRREVEVLRLVAAGRTTSDIAAELFISSKTADHHIQHIYTKIGASNRATATRWALAHEIVADTTLTS